MKRAWQITLAGWLGTLMLRMLGATLRMEVHDASGFCARPPLAPGIGLFWHNRMLMIPVIWSRLRTGLPTACLTSTSKDGEITARILAGFGFESIRGSTSKRGVGALLGMQRALKRGVALAIVPDGPRGPCYQMQPGAVKLAMDTGTPLVCVCWEVDRCWRLKSWDRFIIPKPFAKLTVTLSAPVWLHGDSANPEHLETLRERMEIRMMQQVGAR